LILYDALILYPLLAIALQIAINCPIWRIIFEGRAESAENILASLFKADLSIGTSRQIGLDLQHL
jgi:hypothetical protein